MKDIRVTIAALKFNYKGKSTIRIARRDEDIYEFMRRLDTTKITDIVEGFLTNTGLFVDRYEAKKIAVAANQLIVPIEETYPALFSEDVW